MRATTAKVAALLVLLLAGHAAGIQVPASVAKRRLDAAARRDESNEDPVAPETGSAPRDETHPKSRRSLVNMVRAADRVIRVEHKRYADCERALGEASSARVARERALNTSIAVLERRLSGTGATERERAEALLEIKRARAENRALADERDALSERVRSLERMQTHLKIRYEDRIRKLARRVEEKSWLALELGVVTAVTAAAAIAQRVVNGGRGRGGASGGGGRTKAGSAKEEEEEGAISEGTSVAATASLMSEGGGGEEERDTGSSTAAAAAMGRDHGKRATQKGPRRRRRKKRKKEGGEGEEKKA